MQAEGPSWGGSVGTACLQGFLGGKAFHQQDSGGMALQKQTKNLKEPVSAGVQGRGAVLLR